ncbi:hypothetical protein P4O66_008448 [Electrophorus voltai]|uniref:Ig-like domain-containing protein n=1 Tax=Electrophorus voltai TaxID=2609070 RepID=A0AAD8ZCU7_9TELE|nr:hypothetical protein P4O66_008448 [Electrophorus voltai]
MQLSADCKATLNSCPRDILSFWQFLCIFFLHALSTGVSDSNIVISHRMEGERLILTCVLSGDENLTQVNWEIQWPNRTNVGIFHPVYGTYVPPEYADRVIISGKHLFSTASLSLEKMPLNEIRQICCVFMTFPSGHLMQCSKISDNDGVNANNRKTEVKEASHELSLFGQLGALTVGCILTLLLFLIPVYVCHKRSCRRYFFNEEFFILGDKSFESSGHITQTHQHLLRAHMFVQTFTENAQEVRHPPPAPGFDPTKLYAKIKNDLYYGRLWKAYQGRARISTQGAPPDPKKIYYRLGERPQQQSDEKQRPIGPDTMVTSSDNNS